MNLSPRSICFEAAGFWNWDSSNKAPPHLNKFCRNSKKKKEKKGGNIYRFGLEPIKNESKKS